MVLMKLLFCVACLEYIFGQNCPEQGISSHVVLNDDSYRLTTLQRGNFTIQGLISLTKWKQCDKVDESGLVSVYAMQYAVDKVNKDKTLIPSGSLGLQLDNVCFNLTFTMARGIEAVSLHRPNSVCRADFLKCDRRQNLSSTDIKPITAIVGTEMSSTSIPLASLLSLYYIPQVSFSASSRLLSKKDLYKSFFRTIPSDTNQIKVMLDIIEKFEWNYVFAIGSDDDYGKLGISELKQSAHAQAKNICIAHDEYIPRGSKQDQKIDDIIQQLEESEGKAQVVVLFCYAETGQKIFNKSKERGINRVWLTSESWNPKALKTMTPDLKNQTVGVITVSLKTYKMPFILKYIRNEIIKNFKCNMWLQNFLRDSFNCQPERISSDKMYLNGTGKGCPCKISAIMEKLSQNIQGTTYNLVDSVSALAHGIHNYIERRCPNPNMSCPIDQISSKQLTYEMFNVSFKNEQGNEISFNKDGDPKFAYYTIENIQMENGSFVYKAVGDWDEKRKDQKLKLNEDKIQWPLWFTKSRENPHPSSRCSRDCNPGEHKVGIQGCCWLCRVCEPGNYSAQVNAIECKKCPEGFHTPDNKQCVETQIRWLRIDDAPGMAIVIISCLGIIIITASILILLKFRRFIVMDDISPHFVMLSCALVFLTFAYGLLHIVKPSQELCQSVNALFYLFLMLYTAIVMVKTQFFTKYLSDHPKTWLRVSLLTSQIISVLFFLVLEAASIIAWFNIDTEQVQTVPSKTNNDLEKRLQCQVDTTAARYVSTFIPIIILIIATFCAFRERNMEHPFYESKFLSFTCIALCIIIVAYMPTFHYVVDKYKSIVMAITMDLFGFTFMGCLIFPKVYVAVMRHKRGLDPRTLVSEDQNPRANPHANNKTLDQSPATDDCLQNGEAGAAQVSNVHVHVSELDGAPANPIVENVDVGNDLDAASSTGDEIDKEENVEDIQDG